MNGDNSAQKLGKRKKLSKSVSGYYSKTKTEKKGHEPLREVVSMASFEGRPAAITVRKLKEQ